jgi:hypothetical protein
MAIPVVDTIQVLDPLNPKELTTWFNANPLAVVISVQLYGNSFIIIHT